MSARPLCNAALIAAVAFGLALPAAAQPAPAQPAAQAFKVGSLDLTALKDADFVIPNDAKTFGVDVGPAAVEKVLAEAGAPTTGIRLSVGGLLVRTGGRLVLIDTGLGPAAHGLLAQSLAKAGVAPDQVTDVLITHSHFDHVGGLVTAEGKPAFPRAKVRMSVKEWAFLQSQAGAKALVAAISAQVETFEPGAVVAPGITSVAVDGHTPGHMAYEIASGDARLLDIGDSAHSSILSLARPDWVMGYDGDAKLGAASRRALLTRLSRSHETVYAPHFPFPSVGTVDAAGPGFVWKPGL